MANFTVSSVRALSNPHEFARGEEYLRRGRVHNLTQEDGVYQAYVRRSKYYHVRFWDEVEGPAASNCTCTYTGAGVCRHVVAAMLALVLGSKSGTGLNLMESGRPVSPDYLEDELSGDPARPSVDEDMDRVEHKPQPVFARDVVTKPVRTLSESATLARAWEFLQTQEVRHIPVVADDDGRILGMISERDLLREAVSDAISEDAKPLTARTASELVNTRILTASEDTTVHQIARVMVEERVGSVPILDSNSSVVGIITRSDLLRILVERDGLAEAETIDA